MKKFLLLVLLFFVHCNKLPIGEDELKTRGDFDARFAELRLLNSLTEFNKYFNLGGSANLVVGMNSEYESRILLKFDFPDSSYQGLDDIKLILHCNNKFERDTIRFSIHLLEQKFTEYETNWFLRTSTEWWTVEGGDFENDSIRFGEIKHDSLLVRFNYIELDRIISSSGLIIIPQDPGFAYFYSKEGGVTGEFQLIKNEVVVSVPLVADCHIVTGPEPSAMDNWLGTGMVYRYYVKFDFDSTLLDKKAIYGQLTFKSQKSFSMIDSFEIGIKELLEPLYPDPDGFETPIGSFVALSRFSVNDTLFDLDIVRHIQRIIEYPDSNFGLFILLSPENYDISRFNVVRNSPSLNVGYIPPPKER
jgi:hypothetical protein